MEKKQELWISYLNRKWEYMYVSNQLIDFLEFVVVGAIIGIVFDFLEDTEKWKM